MPFEPLIDLTRRVLGVDCVELVCLDASGSDTSPASALPQQLQLAFAQAVSSGEVVAFSDDCETGPADSTGFWGARVGIPLGAGDGNVEAVLCIAAAAPREWQPAHLELLQQFGDSLLAQSCLRQQAEAADQARREAEGLLNDVDAIVWEADPVTFQFSFVSRQAERLLGYAPLEWLEPGFWARILHPEDLARTVEFCRRATDEGRDHSFEFRAVTADGRTAWLRDRVCVILGADGAVQALRGVMVEITAEKEATTDLQQISERARCILWTAEVREMEGRFDWTSLRVSNEEAAQRLLSLDLAPGQTYASAWYLSKPPEDRERMSQISETALREGRGSYHQEYRCTDREGRLRWFLEEALVEPQTSGGWRITGVSTDITARKLAESALAESESRYRSLTEHSTDLLFVLDDAGRIVYGSPSVERLLGYTPGALHGQVALDLVHPEDRDEMATQLQRRIMQPDCPIESTPPYRYRAQDGTWRYLESTATNLLDNPTVRGVVINSREVSERVRMEADLRYTMAHARCILWHAEIEDLEGRELHWRMSLTEPAAAQRFFPLDVPTGKSYFQVWFESRLDGDRERSDAYGEAEVRAGRSFRQEFRCRDATGAVRWLREDVRVEPLAPGRWKAAGVCTDVTEQREAEAALREREELLRLVSEAANDVIWSWDFSTGAFSHYGAIQAVLGGEPNDSSQDYEWWKARLHPEDQERVTSSFLAALEGPDSRWSSEYRFRKPDGTYSVLLDRAYCVRDNEGKPRRIVGAMMDVTRHRDAEERLHEAQKMEAVGRLAGGVAHDFNNMLAVINGYCELLLANRELPALARRPLEEVSKAGARAASLTRQLLAFGRKQLVTPEAVDLAEVVGSIHQMLRALIGEHIRFEVSIHGMPGCVFADRGQLEQALVNLVVNARDAMPRGGRLSLEVREVEISESPADRPGELTPGAYVLLTVSDTGAGIPEEVLSHIFEPFFTTKAVGEGTGLGLATVYAIVQQCDGHVEVDSRPEYGTTFRIYLPRMQDPAPRFVGGTYAQMPPQGTETVLVVEDEPMLRQLVADVLQNAGYRLLLAANRKEALVRAEEHTEPIHLLLTDVVMPGGSGRELAQELTAKRPGIAVLYMSGHTDDAILQYGISAAEVDFLQKPFTPSELTVKVRSVLERSQLS